HEAGLLKGDAGNLTPRPETTGGIGAFRLRAQRPFMRGLFRNSDGDADVSFLRGLDGRLGIDEFFDEDASEAAHAFNRRGYSLPARCVCDLPGLAALAALCVTSFIGLRSGPCRWRRTRSRPRTCSVEIHLELSNAPLYSGVIFFEIRINNSHTE